MIQPIYDQTNQEKGFITLFTILILSVIGMTFIMTLFYLGITDSKASLIAQNSAQARMVVNSCVEKALSLTKISPTNSLNGSLNISGGSCSYAVSPSVGTTSIMAFGTVGDSTRKVRVTLTGTSPVTITNWEEIP
jgi:hypothetical protein